MNNYTSVEGDYNDSDWESENEHEERVAEKNKNKEKQASRRLSTKRRMDDYLDLMSLKQHSNYLDSYDSV